MKTETKQQQGSQSNFTPRPNLNELAKQVYQANKLKGFHDEEHSNEHYLCLVISELMEAVEADRKGKRSNLNRFYLVLKEEQRLFIDEFEYCIKDTLEDELADAIIRLLDLAGLNGVEIDYEEPYSIILASCRFTTYIFHLATSFSDYVENDELINDAVGSIEALAYSLNIDIWRHVDLKLKYNATRERLHGKKY